MESAAVFSSYNCAVSHALSIRERPGIAAVNTATRPAMSKSSIKGFPFHGMLVSGPSKWNRGVINCVKASETAAAKCGASSESQLLGSPENSIPQSAKFPNGFETLVQNVCDKTEIAELKLKVGDFEMLVKRNIAAAAAPFPVGSPVAPPVPSETRTESAPAPPSPPSKTSTREISPFTNVAFEKSSKLAALEASGSSGFVPISSPTVGSFRKGRTIKGKKQPPICKEGAVIKEGQVIGYVDQFGTEHPVKSDVAGEVVKVLFGEGEAVGYGDPLVAVLPSFHGIE